MALGWQQRDDARQLVGETQIQQAICLVQHQRGDVCKRQCVLIKQIQQTPRCRHHDISAAAQAHHLRVDRYAAEHHGGFDRDGQVLRDAVNRLTDLRRQLARGHEDERLDG